MTAVLAASVAVCCLGFAVLALALEHPNHAALTSVYALALLPHYGPWSA